MNVGKWWNIVGKRIVIIQGHPDAASPHLLHAMADAYALAAAEAGHEIRRIDVATLDFPLLRSPSDFETGTPPASLHQAQADLLWAEHWVILFPLWLGTLPALLKAFFEQLFRPGFATEFRKGGFPRKLLKGRSARIIVTMGMPAFLYRWLYGAHGVRSFEANILRFAGIGPIRRTLIGPAPTDRNGGMSQRARMSAMGRRAD